MCVYCVVSGLFSIVVKLLYFFPFNVHSTVVGGKLVDTQVSVNGGLLPLIPLIITSTERKGVM